MQGVCSEGCVLGSASPQHGEQGACAWSAALPTHSRLPAHIQLALNSFHKDGTPFSAEGFINSRGRKNRTFQAVEAPTEGTRPSPEEAAACEARPQCRCTIQPSSSSSASAASPSSTGSMMRCFTVQPSGRPRRSACSCSHGQERCCEACSSLVLHAVPVPTT